MIKTEKNSIGYTIVKYKSYIYKMKSTTIDRTKLMTATNYAAKYGGTRQTVYNRIKSGELKFEKIDGVVFVKLD